MTSHAAIPTNHVNNHCVRENQRIHGENPYMHEFGQRVNVMAEYCRIHKIIIEQI